MLIIKTALQQADSYTWHVDKALNLPDVVLFKRNTLAIFVDAALRLRDDGHR